jgi:hypothetical protein
MAKETFTPRLSERVNKLDIDLQMALMDDIHEAISNRLPVLEREQENRNNGGKR